MAPPVVGGPGGRLRRDRVQARGTRDVGGTPALAELTELAAAGDLAVPITATYPLGQVRDAYRHLAERRSFGRIAPHPASTAEH